MRRSSSPRSPSVPLPRARGRAGEGGYNMVMLIVAITVLNILVAAVLPLMSTEIQREKEEELVFRGFQYAEAIRLFHARFQRYPNKLEELLEVKPRCIRQLWKDPLTKDGKWGLIPLGQVAPPHGRGAGAPGGGGNAPPQTSDDPNQGGLNTPKEGEVVYVGPIIGVYSKSPRMSHLVFYGHEHYDEWQFTETLLTGRAQISGVGAGGGKPEFSTRWLGRPMQFVDQAQPLNGTLPGQTGAGGRGGATDSGTKKKP
jgi:type II secretory pathway pseudopilin PulG